MAFSAVCHQSCVGSSGIKRQIINVAAVTPAALRAFAKAARKRLRNEGGG
ncbi:MAG: hypothetical protein LBV50_11180 [Novosphingobium sp.]|jgi:hypothetical protein|nr:hypothetical protein [Novosphingobium sp.]